MQRIVKERDIMIQQLNHRISEKERQTLAEESQRVRCQQCLIFQQHIQKLEGELNFRQNNQNTEITTLKEMNRLFEQNYMRSEEEKRNLDNNYQKII